MSDTIFALSSGQGVGGIAVIRVSGEKAKESFKLLTGKKNIEPRYAQYCVLKHPKTGKHIDHAVALYFKNPASFTGEDIVEYNIHGGRAVIQALLDVLSSFEDYRMAEAGEFTKRAFENGKMDLTEAEGIADLIHAETEAQRAQALDQLEGSLGNIYKDWQEKLKKILAHQEADIEFPEEDMPEGVSSAVSGEVQILIDNIKDHLDDNNKGERVRDGISVVLLGAPNVGKSSLLNVLAKRDVAIVSDQAGTTRDIIEVHLDLGGFPVVLADMAGLRKADKDKIEAEGIKRALDRAEQADIKIAIFDALNPDDLDKETLDLVDENTLVLFNKIDIQKLKPHKIKNNETISISVKTGYGIEGLLKALTKKVQEEFDVKGAPSLTRERHRDTLKQCLNSLERSMEATFPELAAEDLRMALRHLGRMTGYVDVEELLDVIFKDFCIGK